MTTNITQQSQEWKAAKQSRIGGSEIYTLAFYYCRKELEQIGVDLVKDQPFQSALELFLRVKYGLEQEPISQVSAQFGNGMEGYIVSRLNNEMSDKCGHFGTKDFIIADNIHNLACCSPDGYIDIQEGQILRDFDDKADITQNIERGTLELKTAPYEFNFEAEAGPKFQYIFQLQYNMMLLGHKWGMLACLAPKEREFETDFHKGKMIGIIHGAESQSGTGTIPHYYIDEYYNLYSYNYIIIPPIQQICKLALDRFHKALEEDNWPTPSIDNKEKVIREKKMLSQIAPERFGTLEASQELDGLLQERQQAHVESLKATTDKTALDIEIIKAMGDHIEVNGVEIKAKYDSRGTLRFSKIK